MSEPCNFFFVCCIIVLYSYLFGSAPRFFFFCCSFCPWWCKSVPVHLLLLYLIGLSPRFFFCCCSFCSLWSKNDIGRSSVKCPCSFVVKHRWARYVVCFFFSLSHGNVSLKIFYLWESRKKVGENGAELGEGGSFAVPNVHRNPSMVVDNKLLVLTLGFFFLL